jgi:hypothetical protein
VHNPDACLIRVNRDDRLLLSLRRNDFGVDVFELSVAVGMLGAFVCLTIGLPREPELYQLRTHRVGADRMPHLREGCGQLLHAFGHPDQGPHGIAQGHGLHQALERGDETRIILAERTTPATGAANLPLRQRLRVEILFAPIDRRTGEPGDLRD